ncbi:GNAT family N-acetyltransferase [Arcicella lustrica]|uniref:GNAT family N-acetyltransferase n=1 Tax=Arcicella lustrica TaxID=2984196 RepID=A0ABU5SCM1_9BACT|nr:GNAT family N-acetyltransferase [Arcicella sp. DC25W]MEA5425030.1 GNAT family N-acetyltransferase [Arcicella sp. DC25W]
MEKLSASEVLTNNYTVQVATTEHLHLAEAICHEMEESAKARGTGIAKRSPEYLRDKINEGKAIIATDSEGNFIGFCYVETWEHGKFVANSGLIVKPEWRKYGIAKAVKARAFELSRTRYPDAKIIGITTSLAVMKINSELGYEPTTFSELPVNDAFWKGCQSCVNYDVLTRTDRKHCLCTGMIFDPEWERKKAEREKEGDEANIEHTQEDTHEKWNFLKDVKVLERLKNIKEKMFLKMAERRANKLIANRD